MPEIGDIVEITRFPVGQRWVVMAPALNAIPPGRLWHLRRETGNGRPLAHTAGDGDLTVIGHPTFVPLQVIDYHFAHDGKATVIADDGETVRIAFKSRRPRSLDRETQPGIDGASFTTVEINADRGALVSMNL